MDTAVFNKVDKNDALLLDGFNKMVADLDMNYQKITKLSIDSHNVLSATNVGYVNEVKGDMITTLTDSFNKKINESHITGSTNKKMFSSTLWMMLINQGVKITLSLMVSKTFLIHLMISIKKAYSFRMGKGLNNEYSSRLNFDMYKLPEEESTFFFTKQNLQYLLTMCDT